MQNFKRHVDIDLSKFAPDLKERDARYGLPPEPCFCSRCVISNQRPNAVPSEFKLKADSGRRAIGFDEAGVCDPCRVWEAKHETVDWVERERMLKDICDRHRRTDGRYDCLIPGSGGKDSFVQAHILKHKYGMNPLTATWAPHIHTDWGWKNFQAWINAGFDNVLITPNGRFHRLLTRLSTETMFHPFQPFVFGQKVLPVRVALQYDIPLIFYGDHGSEWGLPKEKWNDPKVDYSFFTTDNPDDLYYGGVSVRDLKAHFGVSDNDLYLYKPVDPEQVVGKIDFYALGFFINWHPQGNYYYAVQHGHFQAAPERSAGTYSKYASIDDKIDDFNFYCYHIKFGIGRATYDAAQEIRARDIERSEGVALVRKYDGEFPQRFADEVFRYLSITPEEFPEASRMFEQPVMDRPYFDHLADRFRSPHLWNFVNGEWQLRHTVWHDAP